MTNYYNLIKQELIDNEVYSKVKDYSKNKHDLETRYNVGKLLAEAGKHYGSGIIKEYSKRLTNDLGKGYSVRSLYNMALYFNLFSQNKILQSMPANFTWSHICEILQLKNINEIKYYLEITITGNLTYRKLHEKIKSNEYERLPDKTKILLINNKQPTLSDTIPDPIIINNPNNKEIIGEKALNLSLIIKP